MIFGSGVSAILARACGGFYLLGTLRIVVVVVVDPTLTYSTNKRKGAGAGATPARGPRLCALAHGYRAANAASCHIEERTPIHEQRMNPFYSRLPILRWCL